MPVTAFDMIQRIEKVIADLPKETENIIRRNEQEILDLNREKQLYDKGIDSNSRQLLAYKPFTIAIKRSKGEIYNRTTLLDTGDFYKGFKIKYNGLSNPFNIFSTDSKSSDLVEKYGDIFGLTEQNERYLNYEIIKPELEKFIKNHIG